MEEITNKEKTFNQLVSSSPLKQKETLSEAEEEDPLVLSELPVSKSFKIQKLSKKDDHFLMSPGQLVHTYRPNPERMLVCLTSFDLLKLYQIEDQKISLVSSHKICFPEQFHPDQCDYLSSTSYQEILIFIKENKEKNSNQEGEGEQKEVQEREGEGEEEREEEWEDIEEGEE